MIIANASPSLFFSFQQYSHFQMICISKAAIRTISNFSQSYNNNEEDNNIQLSCQYDTFDFFC